MDASPDFPRQSRAPVFNMPGVVTASIAVLVAIQAIREYLLSDVRDIAVVLDLALVPARWPASSPAACCTSSSTR